MYRNEKGIYIKEEWTAISDIGKKFDGIKFNENDYFIYEDYYIQAVMKLIKYQNVKTMKVHELEIHMERKETIKDYLNIDDISLHEGNNVKVSDIPNIVRLILRNRIWCKLINPHLFIHFGEDYYMYAGTLKGVYQIKDSIENGRLFVESKISPYLDWVQEGNYDIIKPISSLKPEELLDELLSRMKGIPKSRRLVCELNECCFNEQLITWVTNELKKRGTKISNKLAFCTK